MLDSFCFEKMQYKFPDCIDRSNDNLSKKMTNKFKDMIRRSSSSLMNQMESFQILNEKQKDMNQTISDNRRIESGKIPNMDEFNQSKSSTPRSFNLRVSSPSKQKENIGAARSHNSRTSQPEIFEENESESESGKVSERIEDGKELKIDSDLLNDGSPQKDARKKAQPSKGRRKSKKLSERSNVSRKIIMIKKTTSPETLLRQEKPIL